jgi:hypothetical protein
MYNIRNTAACPGREYGRPTAVGGGSTHTYEAMEVKVGDDVQQVQYPPR